MSFLGAYIMRGRMQAMMVASTLALLSLIIPPVSIVSLAAVSLVTLRRGGYEGLLVLGIACFAVAILGVLLFGSFQFAVAYGLTLWLPIWIISIVLREGRHLSLALEIAVLFGILAVIGFYYYFGEPAIVWQQVFEPVFQAMPATSGASEEQIKQSIVYASHFMTGVVAASSVICLLLGLLLARWWQAVLYNPGGFRKEYLVLQARPIMAITSIIMVLLAGLSGGLFSELAMNILILLIVLYVFIGFAVLHSLLVWTKVTRFLISVFYVLLFIFFRFFPQIFFILFAMLGFADTWLDLRKNISNQTSA